MYYLHNSRLTIQDKTEKFVALEVDYYCNKVNNNINEYENFQLIAWKIAEKQLAQSVYLQRQFFILVTWTEDNKISEVYFSSTSYIFLRKIVAPYSCLYDLRK